LFRRQCRGSGRMQHPRFDVDAFRQKSHKDRRNHRSADDRACDQGRADQLTNHADIVRMAHPPIRPARHERHTGQDDDTERPEGTKRRDRPPLQHLRAPEQCRAGNQGPGSRTPPHGAFGEHGQERRRVRETHRLVHVAAGFDPAAPPLCALVPRRTTRLDEHQAEHDDESRDLNGNGGHGGNGITQRRRETEIKTTSCSFIHWYLYLVGRRPVRYVLLYGTSCLCPVRPVVQGLFLRCSVSLCVPVISVTSVISVSLCELFRPDRSRRRER
jgi:hypothetical protein